MSFCAVFFADACIFCDMDMDQTYVHKEKKQLYNNNNKAAQKNNIRINRRIHQPRKHTHKPRENNRRNQ